MNAHARKRLYESTIVVLEGLLATQGRTITVPQAVARNIHALAYDLTGTVARKAKLEPSPQWQVGPTRIGGEVVGP